MMVAADVSLSCMANLLSISLLGAPAWASLIITSAVENPMALVMAEVGVGEVLK